MDAEPDTLQGEIRMRAGRSLHRMIWRGRKMLRPGTDRYLWMDECHRRLPEQYGDPAEFMRDENDRICRAEKPAGNKIRPR